MDVSVAAGVAGANNGFWWVAHFVEVDGELRMGFLDGLVGLGTKRVMSLDS